MKWPMWFGQDYKFCPYLLFFTSTVLHFCLYCTLHPCICEFSQLLVYLFVYLSYTCRKFLLYVLFWGWLIIRFNNCSTFLFPMCSTSLYKLCYSRSCTLSGVDGLSLVCSVLKFKIKILLFFMWFLVFVFHW